MYEEVYRLAELIHAAAEALNDPSFFYGSLNLQGWVALSKGEYALATRAGEQVSEGFKNGNYQQKMAGIYLLFTVALSQENPSLARSYLSRMPQSQLFFYYGSTNYGSVNYGFLASLGRLAALEGQMEQAATLFGIREASPAVQFGRAYTDYLELISVVKAALGEEAYNAAWEAGHRMTEEEALAYAQAVYANDPNAQHDAPA